MDLYGSIKSVHFYGNNLASLVSSLKINAKGLLFIRYFSFIKKNQLEYRIFASLYHI